VLACDARALEEVDGNRVAQLPAVAEAVIGDPNSLVYAAIDAVGARPGAEAERITQVGGQRALDRFARHVGPCQKDVRRGNVLRAEFRVPMLWTSLRLRPVVSAEKEDNRGVVAEACFFV